MARRSKQAPPGRTTLGQVRKRLAEGWPSGLTS